jgi:hypothetical protein
VAKSRYPNSDRDLGQMDAGRGYPLEVHTLLDSAIRHHAFGRDSQLESARREWVLVDTRRCDPGEYLIRGWTDAEGVSRPVQRPPSRRRGGVIGLFTLHEDCTSTGPCPGDVDDGAGLLLIGFESILALPLPPAAHTGFDANWILVLSASSQAFRDLEVDRVAREVSELFCRSSEGRVGPSAKIAGRVLTGSDLPMSARGRLKPPALSRMPQPRTPASYGVAGTPRSELSR